MLFIVSKLFFIQKRNGKKAEAIFFSEIIKISRPKWKQPNQIKRWTSASLSVNVITSKSKRRHLKSFTFWWPFLDFLFIVPIMIAITIMISVFLYFYVKPRATPHANLYLEREQMTMRWLWWWRCSNWLMEMMLLGQLTICRTIEHTKHRRRRGRSSWPLTKTTFTELRILTSFSSRGCRKNCFLSEESLLDLGEIKRRPKLRNSPST